MKKCPYCNAEIEEDSKFCLYCMTSFDEKTEIVKENKKVSPFLYIAVFAVLAVLIAVFIIAFKGCGGKSVLPAGTQSVTESDTAKTQSENNFEIASENKETESSKKSNTVSNSKNSSSHTESEQKSLTSENVSVVETSSAESGRSKTAENTVVEYIYRDAKQNDDFYTAANIENCVVITGIKTASKTGEYVIPDTIDGKKVIAVMGGAFSGNGIKQTVKKVTVSANVKTIWNYAFGGCNNLTDIYFKGNAIYTDAFAFDIDGERAGTFTIHCSADCNDRNFRYYKNTAPNYDAVWKEWNG